MPNSPETQNQVIRIGSNEVLLDIIVRDKRGRPVRDLRSEEIEIYEDNARQAIASFRLIETTPTNANASTHKGGDRATTVNKPFDPALPINLVTMVFDNLDASGRRLAGESANHFFQQLPQNTFVAVFAVNLGFHLLQHFTNDPEKLRQAIELLSRRADNRFPSLSKQIVQQLEVVANSTDFGPPAGAPAQSPSSNSGNTPGARALAGMAPTGVPGGGGIDRALAQITLNSMRAIESAQLDMQARASVQALINLIRQQKRLTGRKTLLYYSNGMVVPPHLLPLVRTTISEANQNNVSIYALDARGLEMSEDTSRAKEKLAQAMAGSLEAQSNGVTSPNSMLASDNVEMALRMNSRGALEELAKGTGGFSVTNTNDLINPLRRIGEELGTYYALTYAPANEKFDGRFRELKVLVKRSDAKVQARSGYFALPTVDGKLVLPHEIPALNAVSARTPPHDFPHLANVLHFKGGPGGVKHLLLLDTPFSDLSFKVDQTRKQYALHVAIMALCKDAEGNVLHRLSQNYPLVGKLERLESLKRGKLAFSENFLLPTGSFTLETVVHDFVSGKTSVQKQPLVVTEASSNLAMSSLFMVRQVEPLLSNQPTEEKPLHTRLGKITPLFHEVIQADKVKQLSFFCYIYTEGNVTPEFIIEVAQGESVIVHQRMEIPKSDEKGLIAHLFNIPLSSLASGRYEMRAITKHNDHVTSERASFTIENPQLPAAPTPIVAIAPSAEIKNENEPEPTELADSAISPTALSQTVLKASVAKANNDFAQAAAVNLADLRQEILNNGSVMQRRLLDFSYNLRKVSYTLSDGKKDFGHPMKEDFSDYEAYPVRGRHVLIQLAANGKSLEADLVHRERQRAGDALTNEANQLETGSIPSYITAAINGSYRGRSAGLLIDPSTFLRVCDFYDPRIEILDGRETIAMDFTPRAGVDLPLATVFILRMKGTIWVDAMDKVLVRLEAYNQFPGLDKQGKPLSKSELPKIVYQQSKHPSGEWFPAVIRMNAAGDASALFGLNLDVIFEFTNYRRFATESEKEKLIIPQKKEEKQPPK